MRDMIKQISYVRGLAEGLEIDEKKDKNRVLLETLKAMELMAEGIEEVAERQELILDVLEEVDRDLFEVEEFLFDGDINLLDDLYSIDFDDIDPFLLEEECDEECTEETCEE